VLASGDNLSGVQLWDPASGSPISDRLLTHASTRSLAWGPLEGRPVLASGDEGGVLLWEPSIERIYPRLPGSRSDDPTDPDRLNRDAEAIALAEMITARSAHPRWRSGCSVIGEKVRAIFSVGSVRLSLRGRKVLRTVGALTARESITRPGLRKRRSRSRTAFRGRSYMGGGNLKRVLSGGWLRTRRGPVERIALADLPYSGLAGARSIVRSASHPFCVDLRRRLVKVNACLRATS
jgi:hypothetical protein